MKKKNLFCFVFSCFAAMQVFCDTKFIVNKSFSIQQMERKEKNIEVSARQLLYSVENDSMIKMIKRESIDEYDKNGTVSVSSTCSDENFIGLNYKADHKTYFETIKNNWKLIECNSLQAKEIT